MFSRRHPYLFFLLVLSAILSVTIIGSSMMMTISSKVTAVSSGENVGVIELKGVITQSRETIEELKAFREDESIKAIVLRIDSPGGGVAPSQEIYREIRKTTPQKTVIASMGSLAASGGYYAAAATNGIMANPGTITGSIGVLMGFTNFEEILKKIGLYPVVIKSGQFKDMGSPSRTMTPKEEALIQDFVNMIHRQFISDVASARNMDFDKISALADGRIYTGEDAMAKGLVDRLGNLEDAIEWAGRLAGIKGKITPVYPQKKLSLLELLKESPLHEMINQLFQIRYSADYLYPAGKPFTQ